ncbi:hypothetical protein C8R47DRAFT_1203913 [Mycena vitilis]|nr:hypothetical protein C8R47DRAFT_1203913 [Mycena vitilis]
MSYTIDPTVFADYWDFVLSRTYGVYTGIFFYGILFVLLCGGTHLLYYRTGAGRMTLLLATSAMAILATVQVVIQIYTSVLASQIVRLAIEGEIWPAAAAQGPTNLYARLYTARDFLFATNNVVTDGLFMYRCFVVWGRSIRIVVLPVLMLVATTVLAYLAAYEDDLPTPYHIDYRIPYGMVIATNVVLMGLTAGRIWWIRRDASLILESAHVRPYNTAIAIILESGALYCLSIVGYLIAVSVPTQNNSLVGAIFIAALPQLMNIVPMLMVVRVGLGRAVEDPATTKPERIIFRSPARNAPQSPMTIRAAPTHHDEEGAEMAELGSLKV